MIYDRLGFAMIEAFKISLERDVAVAKLRYSAAFMECNGPTALFIASS
jgi:hypothetical protein